MTFGAVVVQLELGALRATERMGVRAAAGRVLASRFRAGETVAALSPSRMVVVMPAYGIDRAIRDVTADLAELAALDGVERHASAGCRSATTPTPRSGPGGNLGGLVDGANPPVWWVGVRRGGPVRTRALVRSRPCASARSGQSCRVSRRSASRASSASSRCMEMSATRTSSSSLPGGLHAVVDHDVAERAGVGDAAGAGGDQLLAALVVDLLADRLLHPHAGAAGAAAHALGAVAAGLDDLDAARGCRSPSRGDGRCRCGGRGSRSRGRRPARRAGRRSGRAGPRRCSHSRNWLWCTTS